MIQLHSNPTMNTIVIIIYFLFILKVAQLCPTFCNPWTHPLHEWENQDTKSLTNLMTIIQLMGKRDGTWAYAAWQPKSCFNPDSMADFSWAQLPRVIHMILM